MLGGPVNSRLDYWVGRRGSNLPHAIVSLQYIYPLYQVTSKYECFFIKNNIYKYILFYQMHRNMMHMVWIEVRCSHNPQSPYASAIASEPGWMTFSVLKETRSVTMNIFWKKKFPFKSFVKIELSYVFTINMFSTAENCIEKWIILWKQVFFLQLVIIYIPPIILHSGFLT